MSATTSAILNKEKEHIQPIAATLTSISSPSQTAQVNKTSQGNAYNGSSKSLSAYKNFLNQRESQLLVIEDQKVKYIDPRNIPLELKEQEKHLQADIERLQHQIVILEQKGDV